MNRQNHATTGACATNFDLFAANRGTGNHGNERTYHFLLKTSIRGVVSSLPIDRCGNISRHPDRVRDLRHRKPDAATVLPE